MKDTILEILMKILIVIMCTAIAFTFIVHIIYRPINKASNERTVTVTVTDKNVKKSDKTDKYLIYTVDTDGETQVFEITDSLWMWRWDSSDLYAKIEIGKTYDFTIRGSRWKMMSFYPNVYEVKLAE